MLHEARPYRRLARAYVRRHSVAELAKALGVSRFQIARLLAGRYHFITSAVATRMLAAVDERSAAYVRSVTVTHEIETGQLPIQLVAPLVRELERRCGGTGRAARWVGIDNRRLFALREEHESGVGFAIVDRLVTRGFWPWLWQEPPLRRWYVVGTPGATLALSNPAIPERKKRARRREAVAA